MVEEQGLDKSNYQPQAYFVLAGKEAETAGLAIAEKLRDSFPKLRLLVNGGAGSFKSQLKRADNSGAEYAFILGENEVAEGTITVKPLRNKDLDQQTLSQTDLDKFISKNLL